MATERQAEYFRDLGIDVRVDLDGIAKGETSEWIDELVGPVERACLPVGRPPKAGIL